MVLGLVGLLLLAGKVAAEPREFAPLEPLAGLTARLRISEDRIGLAGAITATVTVEGPAPLQIEPIKDLITSPLWDQKADAPARSALPDGRERWQQTIRLDPRGPTEGGQKVGLPVVPLRLRRGEAMVEVKWAPVEIAVTSTLAQPSLDQARGVPPIEKLPPSAPMRSWLPIIGLGLAGLCGLAGVLWLVRGRRRPTPALPPHLAALAELDRVEALDLPAAGASERYHTLLANAVRTYLDRRFALRSQEQTTPEFFARLPAAPPWPPAAQQQLQDFLQLCDLAKFAGVRIAPAECRRAADLARSFIQTTAEEARNEEPSIPNS